MIAYHFTYSYKEKKPLSEVYSQNIEGSNQRNFSLKSFYSLVTKKVYTFFRQGQGITVDAANPD